MDPVQDEEMVEWLHFRGISSASIIVTHEHYDHMLGIDFWEQRLVCQVISTVKAEKSMPLLGKNLSKYNDFVLIGMKVKFDNHVLQNIISKNLSCEADITFDDKMLLQLGNNTIRLIAISGHSPGSLLAMVNDSFLFTGDNLIKDKETILFMPEGNEIEYRQKGYALYKWLT